MKKSLAYAILFTLTVVACSPSEGTFRLKGRFKNFNQGELFVYGLTGKAKIDTVKLMEGRFTYEVPMEDTLLLSVVFPNYSEIPVIAMPGTAVAMEGDASHLREVKVTGNKENEALTKFRLDVNDMTPPEVAKAAAQFVGDHPASPASLFVLNKYFLLRADADYAVASQLLDKMAAAAPTDRRISRLRQQVGSLRAARQDRLPKFTATTTTGRKVTNADMKGELNVITLWAVWNYDSQAMQRQLRRLKKTYGERLQLLSISIDGNPDECKKMATRDSLTWPVVCDGKMWDMPIVSQLGFNSVPSVILADRSGKVLSRKMTTKELKDEIEKRLK